MSYRPSQFPALLPLITIKDRGSISLQQKLDTFKVFETMLSLALLRLLFGDNFQSRKSPFVQMFSPKPLLAPTIKKYVLLLDGGFSIVKVRYRFPFI